MPAILFSLGNQPPLPNARRMLRRTQRHSAHLFVQTADIETTSPDPKTYTQKADSGNEMTRAWCDGCGAGVWLRSASKPGLTFLKAGEFGEKRLIPWWRWEN